MIGKLMGIASIGSSLANVTLLHRFLEGIIGLIALTILSTMMAGMLLVGIFYGAYQGLTSYGLDPAAALMIVMIFVGALTAAGAGLAWTKLRQLQQLPYHTLPHGFSQWPRMAMIAQAFIQGFKTRPSALKN